MFDGILLVDKPAGMTSHDVVAQVRRIVRQATSHESRATSQDELTTIDSRLPARAPKVRVGHTGTLDPAATGLMILVLGKYTKRAGEFSKLDKTYEAELTLGKTSTTGDSEGAITTKSGQRPTKVALQAVLGRFKGQISQTPPIHSAIKIDGQRAYKLARKGLTPNMKPREVTIYSLVLTDYTYPKVKITTAVSSGTYIRSLAEDIGAKLGTGAYMSALRRTDVGQFSIREAISLENCDYEQIRQSMRTVA